MIIDNKVVEMKFDNKDFEKNVKTSMNTLDKLDKSLKATESNNKAFESLAASLKKIDFGSMASGIDAISKRFSTMGIVGMRVIENLTDSAMRFVNNTIGKMFNQIKTGGINRATNIENAKFQLQGLLKDEEKVQAVLDNVNESVSGTAYGYDEAASAASQFAASGIEAGDQMLAALKGITGVAAMTNSGFSDIANIFTTIAGNGKVMGDQLNQLAGRGMNAASTLTEYFNKVNSGAIKVSESTKKAVQSVSKSTKLTEQEIREFVSKGKISFAIFSNAMNDTFGEHAKKANETLNGSLSNMKAALSRIGAEFVSPLIEQNGPLVKMFNALREMFNEVKKKIVPFAKVITDSISRIIDKFTTIVNVVTTGIKTANMADHLEKVTKILQIFENVLDGIVKSVKYLKNLVIPVFEAISNVIHDSELSDIAFSIDNVVKITEKFSLFSRNLIVTQNKANEIYDNFWYIFANMYGVLDDFARGIKSVAGAFKSAWIEMFPEDILDDIYVFFNILSECLQDVLIPSEKTVENLKTIFKAFFAVIDIGNQLFQAFFPILTRFGGWFLKHAIAIAATIAKWVIALNNYFKANDTFRRIANGLLESVSAIGDAFKAAYVKIDAFITKLSGKSLSEIFKKIGDSITDFFKGVGMIFSGENITKVFTTFAEKIRSAFGIVKDSTEGFGSIDTSGPKKFAEGLKKVFAPLGVVFDFIKTLFQALWKLLQGVWPAIKRIFTDIGNMFKSVIDKFKAANSTDILNYIKSGSLIVLTEKISKLIKRLTDSVKTTGESVGGLKEILANVNGVIKKVTSVLAGVKDTLIVFQKDIKANILIKIALAVAILTASLIALSGVDNDKLMTALEMITFEFIELVGAMKILTSGSGSLGGFSSIGTMIVKLAASVWILAKAMQMLSEIDKERLDDALTTLSMLLVELTAVVKILTSGNVAKAPSGLISLALAVLILTGAVKSLAKVDADRLWAAVGAIAAIFAALSMSIRIMGSPERMISLGLGMILFASSMKIFASSVSQLAKIDNVSQGLDGFTSLMFTITSSMTVLTRNSKGIIKVASSLIIFAVAMTIMAAAFKIFSSGGLDAVQNGLIAFAGTMIVIAASFRAMQADTKGMLKVVSTLLTFSIVMTIIAAAFRIFAAGDMKKTESGLIAFAGTMFVIVATFKILQDDILGLFQIAGAISVFAIAMVFMASAIKKLGTLGYQDLFAGLVGFAGVMGILILTIKALSKDVEGAEDVADAMEDLADAIEDIADAVIAFSEIEFKNLIVGLMGFAGAMGIIVATVSTLQSDSKGLTKIAIALSIISKAVLVLSIAMKIFGSMGILSIVGSLVMLAGSFAVLWVGAKLLKAVIPVLLQLGTALGTLALGVLAIGSGMFMLSVALVSIAAAGTAAVAALVSMIKGLIGLLPYLGEQLGIAIGMILVQLNKFMPELGEFLGNLFKVIFKSVGTLLDSLVDLIMEFLIHLLNSLNQNLPSIVEKLVELFCRLIDVLGQSVKKIVDKLINLVLNLVEALSEGLRKNARKIADTFFDLIVNVLASVLDMIFPWLIDWITGGTDDVVKVVNVLTAEEQAALENAKKVKEAYESVMQARNEGIKDAKGEYDYIEELKREYNSLVGENGYIIQGYEDRADAIKTTLAEALGIELQQVNDLIDANGKLGQSFDNVIAKMQAEAYLSANKEAYETAIKNKKEAYDAYIDTGNKYNDLLARYQEADLRWQAVQESAANMRANNNAQAAEALLKQYDYLKQERQALGEETYNMKLTYQEMEDVYTGYTQTIQSNQQLLSAVQNGTVDDMLEAMSKLENGYIDQYTGTQRTLEKQVRDYQAKYDNLVKAAEEGWGNVTQEEIDEAQKLLGLAQGELVKYENAHREGIEKTQQAMIEGTKKSKEDLVAAEEEEQTAVVQSWDDMPDTMGGVMDGTIQGMVDSATSDANLSKLSNAGATDYKAYQSGYLSAADQHSPSRKMKRVGNYTIKGLIMGMLGLKDQVNAAGAEVGDEALDGISKVISNISEVLGQDIDSNPTIRPVLDLSDVANGVNSMDDMFNSDKTIGLTGKALLESNAAWANNQNGIQVNNSDVVSVLTALREDISSLEEKVGNMQLVMDTGALVGQISGPIDSALGRQTLYRGRGI